MTAGAPADEGFFSASVVYGHDRSRTHDALEEAGRHAVRTLMAEAIASPAPADSLLLQRIHRAWFGAAFPDEAGRFRREVVLSRRPSVSLPHAIANDVAAAFTGFEDDWVGAGGDAHVRRASNKVEIGRLISLANRIAVRLHHIHPFLDGNTRACMTLRAYLLVRAGLPLVEGRCGESRARQAWNEATPWDHQALDHVLFDQLGDLLKRL